MIGRGVSAQDATQAVYNPYPPGILPPDLVPEIDRVVREVNLIEKEALTQWHALPKNSGTAMRQVQMLVKLDFSTRISRLTVPAAKNAGFVSIEVAAWNLDSLCVIEWPPIISTPNDKPRKG